MLTLVMMIIAYGLGSLSTAILYAKYKGLPDPRQAGSGNAGATNIARIAGRNAAIIVLAGDALKGLIPILLAKFFGLSGGALGMIALAAMLGHIFPIFFEFKGGKGVATALGGLIGISFWLGLFLVIAWVIVASITRYASLSSLVAAVLAPIFGMLFVGGGMFLPGVIIAALIIWTHRDNIQRLRRNEESKIGEKL